MFRLIRTTNPSPLPLPDGPQYPLWPLAVLVAVLVAFAAVGIDCDRGKSTVELKP